MLSVLVAHVVSLSLVPLAAAAEVECWAPDGKTRADNETYVPCNKLGITQDGVYSSCCRLDGEADKRDLCATSGLCLNGGVLFRAYCTDKTWDSPACVSVCTDDSKGGSSNETVEITPCTDGKYCCGHNNLNCCGTDEAFEIPTQASVVSDNTTETTVVTETASPPSSTYKNATIGLAVVLGVGALAAAGAILWLLKKNKSLYEKLQQIPPAIEERRQSDYRDPYLQDQSPGTAGGGTVASSSPRPGTYTPHKSPASPTTVPEVDGSPQRCSELDATATTRSHIGPASHGPDNPSRSTPIVSSLSPSGGL